MAFFFLFFGWASKIVFSELKMNCLLLNFEFVFEKKEKIASESKQPRYQ